MVNTILAKSQVGTSGGTTVYYLDTAAELSKLNRRNHKQVSDKGVPMMYDLTIEISTPGFLNEAEPFLKGSVFVCPDHWVTRNAVRQTHFTREDLRKESGVTKGAIGRYAKNLRLNMESGMFNVTYDDSTTVTTGSPRRVYAQNDASQSNGVAGNNISGGTWDYSQLAQVDPTDRLKGDPFYVNVCGGHSAAAPGPYTYVAANLAYLQRRQTVQLDATQTSGGDTVNVNTESPFFRIPEQDESEDVYQLITYDEQDNPPYDRLVSGSVADSADRSPVLVDTFGLGQSGQGTNGNAHVVRVQAPLGLVKMSLIHVASADMGDIHFQITCHGTYEMS